MTATTHPVRADSPEFEAVCQLWRASSATLGHMPRGGFVDAAEAGCLVAAKSTAGDVVGYVMFRASAGQSIAITHLCVAPAARGAGTARLLFEAVKRVAERATEIRVRCRRDYAANSMWPRLGFIAAGEIPARAAGSILTVWRYELSGLPILKRLSMAAPSEQRLRVAVDANVFFDVDPQASGNPEAAALTAGWLGEWVDLAVTEEIYNEINRRDSGGDRERQRRRAIEFGVLPRDVDREEALLGRLKTILPTHTENRLSDARQLAMAAAIEAAAFVTRDSDVLGLADAIYQQVGLRVVRPHELIQRFDQIQREQEYRPERLHMGPGVRSRLAISDDVERIVELMHSGHPAPEPRRRSVARLREQMARPDRVEIRCVEVGSELLVAYALDRSQPGTLRVPYFAVADSSLGETAARHWGEYLLRVAAYEGRSWVDVDAAGRRVCDALGDLGYAPIGTRRVKLTLPMVASPAVVAERIRALQVPEGAADLAVQLAQSLDLLTDERPETSFAVERTLWPAKLLNSGLRCFIVPIRPKYAEQLFDEEYAARDLFGADASLILKVENAYYRAARPLVLQAPSRVLWYVSGSKRYGGSKAIRAASLIDEVLIGPAKELYRRFQRLGVYRWKDVTEVAKGEPSRDIMAFTFSKTELFRRPVRWNEIQRFLREGTGSISPIVSPVEIPEAVFIDLYSAGTSREP